MKKRALSLALVMSMVAAMAVGCGGKGDSNNGDGFVDDNVKKYYEKTGNEDDKDIEVSWCVIAGKDEYYQYYWDEMKGLKAIQDATGVKINFQVKTGYSDYLPMFSAQNYPDVITAKNLEQYPGRMAGMYNDKVSVKLNDYMEEWMPNFSKIVEDYPQIARDLKMDDGSYTFVSALYDIDDEDDRAAASQYGLAIRKDWLDTVGYDVPVTINDWHNVLLAFKNDDPNGDGQSNEEPVCMASSGWKYFLAAYGIDDDPCVQKNEDGTETIIYGFITEAYKEWLTEMKMWNDEGLIYNMFENTSLEKRQERVTGNYAGSWKGDAQHFDEEDKSSYISLLREIVPEAEFAAVEWPVLSEGAHQWCFSDIASFDRDTTVITDNAKKHGTDKAAAYIIDYMLGEQGSTLLTWGIEGSSYEEKNGEKTLKDGMKDTVDFHGEKIQARYTYADPITVMFPQFGQMSDYVLANKSEGYVDACETWAKGDTSYKVNAACQLSVEQQEEVDEVTEGMKAYISKMRMRFIQGKAPLTEYDAYVAQVKGQGGDKYAEIWGEAYNNYKNR